MCFQLSVQLNSAGLAGVLDAVLTRSILTVRCKASTWIIRWFPYTYKWSTWMDRKREREREVDCRRNNIRKFLSIFIKEKKENSGINGVPVGSSSISPFRSRSSLPRKKASMAVVAQFSPSCL
jgi:hypothetical protein